MTVSPVAATVGRMDLIGTSEVARLADASRRTVEDWIARGWLAPAAVVGQRNLWTRTYIDDWLAHPRPSPRRADPGWAPYPPPEPLDLIGLDDIADLLDCSVPSARWKVNNGSLPQPVAKVSGALIWRADAVAS